MKVIQDWRNFNDEKVSEEDKMKMRDSLLEAFYDAKSKNKRK